MPNITLYVKDSDLAVIEKAKKKLGASLSAVFTDCVRERLTLLAAPTEPTGKMERIVLDFWNENEQPTIHKSFRGRWLVGDSNQGLRAADDGQQWDAGAEYSVAQTAQGNLVVYVQHCNGGWAPSMETYASFAEMKDAVSSGFVSMFPENVIAETAAELNEPYEIELDI